MTKLRFTVGRAWRGVTTFAVVLLLWWVVVRLGDVPQQFLPSPSDIIHSGASLIQTSGFWIDMSMSIMRVVGSLLISGLIAIPLGLALAVSSNLRRSFDPLVNFIRYLPLPGFIPLTILWFGIGETQKIIVLFIGTFFQLLPLVMNAGMVVDSRLVDTAQNLGASRLGEIWHVTLPAAGPEIYEGLRISSGIAWTYLTVAEIVAAPNGLGHLIVVSQRYLQTPNIFVAILTIGFLGVLTDALFHTCKPLVFPHLRNCYDVDAS